MGEGVKLVPKRKLIGGDGGDIDVTISHILDNLQNIVPQIQTSWTITGGSPSLYFIESDQTDPDGRWRLQGTAKGFVIQRQLTAGWATSINALAFDPDNSRTDLTGPLASGLGGIYLTSGNSSTTGASLKLGTSATSGLDVLTANASGAATSRLHINTGVATATIDLTGTVAIAGNVTITGTTTIGTILAPTYGQSLYLRANSAATQATEYSIYLQALNAAADSFLDMITITPNGASPTINFNARAITSAGNITCGTGTFYLASGSTSGDVLQIRGNNSVFISCLTSTPNTCTVDGITMSGTWLASGTVTLPAITFSGKITSSVAAGSPILKAIATSDSPTATWGLTEPFRVSTAPSGWLEMQDGDDNTRYIPFWA